ncbi:MAG: hypothetical protein ACLR4Z_17600, partial [Butyricicoccaceae bacterium]
MVKALEVLKPARLFPHAHACGVPSAAYIVKSTEVPPYEKNRGKSVRPTDRQQTDIHEDVHENVWNKNITGNAKTASSGERRGRAIGYIKQARDE